MPEPNKLPKKVVKPEADDNELPRSPRGMRDIIGDDWYKYQGLFEKAAEVALYYGFKPIETPFLEKEDLFRRSIGAGTDIVEKEMYTLKTRGGDRLALRPEGTASVMRAYLENGLQAWPQPVMLYYHGPFFRHETPQRGRFREFWQFGLEILGTGKSIADALIINLFVLILNEAGLTNLTVEINSLGDKDCRPVYKRELVNYYRKHSRQICPDCRERLKTNPLRVLDCKNQKCQEIKRGAPETIGFLCSACKQHFREVLEYLDALKIPYLITHTLVRGLDYYTRTVFEISAPPANEPGQETALPLTLASGGRYDYLARQLGHKKEVPAVGGALGADRVTALPETKNLSPRLIKKPKIFFIQLGLEAKLRSFEVIEVLRKTRTPIGQSLSRDSLASQLAAAEKSRAPYVIILGQKEALEGSVIVRNMASRSQDTVKISVLADYLKKLFAK